MFKLFTKSSAGRLLSDAVGEATLLTERHDVPHEIDGQRVADFAPDLDDTDPRWWRTRDGHRIAGRLLPNDLAGGGPSPATPLLIGLLPLLAMSTLLLSRLPHIGGLFMGLGVLLMLIAAGTLWAAEGFKTAIGTLLLGAFLPLAAATAALGGPSSGAVAPAGRLLSMVQSPMALALPVGALLIIALIFSGSFSKAMIAARAIIGGLVAIVVLAFVSTLLRKLIGPTASVLPWFAVGAGLPWLWAQWNQREWAMRLVAQDVGAPGETALGAMSEFSEARHQQAESALRDKTPVFDIGVATGAFSARGDGLAPDAKKMVCQSAQDMSEHVLVCGSTGSGKTTSVLRPAIAAWVEAKVGGMLVLDEKDLPAELRGLRGYTLIEHSTKLGLLEGLSASEVVEAVFSVGEGDKNQVGGKGASAFFDSAARTLLLHAAVLTHSLVVCERKRLAETLASGEIEASRTIRWTVANIRELLGLASGDATRDATLALVDGIVPEHEGEKYMLAGMVEYFQATLPAMDADTRSNIFATLAQKLDPIVSHPELVAFAHHEKSDGFDISDIRFGASFGVNLPKAIYGNGGVLISALVKARVISLVRRRASYDWKAAGERPILNAIDEAASIIDASDASMLKVSRSLGLTYLVGVQNLDAFVWKLGSEALAQSMFDNFRSFITLVSTPYTLEQMSKRLGTTRQLKWSSKTSAVNFARSMELLASSALVDPTHPAHPHLRSLLRSGSGLFKELGDGVAKNSDLMKISPVDQARFEDLPLFGPVHYGALAAKKFKAVVSIQRAGVPRRDIVDLTPMFAFPAALMEPESVASEPQPVPMPEGAGEVLMPTEATKSKAPAIKIIPSIASPAASMMDGQTPAPKAPTHSSTMKV